jgi:hypothetical protein
MAVRLPQGARDLLRRRCGFAGLLVVAAALAASGCAASSAHTGGATPTPTVTFNPATFTPNPLTPTPTEPERHLEALVWQAIGGSDSGALQVQATYSPTNGAVDVSVTFGGRVPEQPAEIAAAQEHVKVVCFQVLRAVWTSGTRPLSQVNVSVLGPVIVLYGDLESKAYGSAYLTAATEARFQWSAISPDQAWDAYDAVYLRSGYNDAQ